MVVAAIIRDEEGRIFATQRGYGDFKDFWEFPGGKIEAGESADQALRREIWEELQTRIVVERLFHNLPLVRCPVCTTHSPLSKKKRRPMEQRFFYCQF